jgi:hypothetical protein
MTRITNCCQQSWRPGAAVWPLRYPELHVPFVSCEGVGQASPEEGTVQVYESPPLYRDSRGVHHATARCPAAADERLTKCSHESLSSRRYDHCKQCIPIPIFVPKAGTTDRRVYHADLRCSSVPRQLRYPVIRYEWVWWPTWDYHHIIQTFDAYRRCKHCIPDRKVLYPLGKKHSQVTQLRPKRHRKRRSRAA